MTASSRRAARPRVGIVAAAGSGERLGADVPKGLVECGGRRLLEWSWDVLDESCDRVIVVTPPDSTLEIRGPALEQVPGGPSRSASVREAVRRAPEAAVYVVQDAARPLLTEALVEACCEQVEAGWDGAVAAAPVSDTIKAVDGEGRVAETLDRSRLWAIQTPQAFEGAALRAALEVDDETLAAATDDAALVEAQGGSVTIVRAPAENIKVTTRADLALAELLLAARAGG